MSDAYETTEYLPGERIITLNTGELIDVLANDLNRFAHQRIHEAGEFHIALSGGTTPQALYQLLMIDPRFRLFPWAFTHLWLVDERCVPANHKQSNFNMIHELLVLHSDIPPQNVHPMPVMEADGDQRYENELRAAISSAGHNRRLDFVLLGMGADGHTASLFPNTPALDEADRWVVFNDGDSVAEPRPRMTLTLPTINAARHIAVLIIGQSKHEAIKNIATNDDPHHLPIAAICPAHDDTKLVWYLDHEAATGESVTEER